MIIFYSIMLFRSICLNSGEIPYCLLRLNHWYYGNLHGINVQFDWNKQCIPYQSTSLLAVKNNFEFDEL